MPRLQTWKKQEQELARRRSQVEDFILRVNALKRERDDARRQTRKLVEILRDVAFSDASKARDIAQRALNRIERKLEKEVVSQ